MFIVIITSITAVIIGWLQFRRSGKIKRTGEATYAETQQNGGNSTRDVLDRIDRRTLLLEERSSRIEQRMMSTERAATATRIHVSAIGKRVEKHTQRLDSLEGGN